MPLSNKTTAFSEILSHPDIQYDDHINGMLLDTDSELEQFIKKCHDIFKLRRNFQTYIRDTKHYKGGEKSHAQLSAWFFLSHSKTFEPLERIIGFLAIFKHHAELIDCQTVTANIELGFDHTHHAQVIEEVTEHLALISSNPIKQTLEDLIIDKPLTGRTLHTLKRQMRTLDYHDYVKARSLIANLFASDKQEAIFHEQIKTIAPKMQLIDFYLKDFEEDNSEATQKRKAFQQTVLDNYQKDHKLYTISAPTGYGKTIAAFKLATKIPAKRWIFALPFTSIVDQTYEIANNIFESKHTIFRFHHKTIINESDDMERYSKLKFLMESFNADITITTTYQMIYTFFGKENMEVVRFHALRDAVVILDEVQSIPYNLRKDFFAICSAISNQLGTTFILMSATMPKSQENFIELSHDGYFSKQNRYKIEWFGSKEKGSTDALNQALIMHSQQKQSCLLVFNEIATCQSFFQSCINNDYIKFDHILCLNGYMIATDAKKNIQTAKKALEAGESVLFISTQSIEAGVDLSFDVGYREIAPVPSIIQTAGRINRHFGTQGTLYVFGIVSEWTDSIYGDLQLVSKFFHTKLQENDTNSIDEKDILQDSKDFFSSMYADVERTELQNDITTLAFETLARRLDKIMHNNDFGKEAIFIETYEGEAKALENTLQKNLKNINSNNKFDRKNIFEISLKKASSNILNLSKNDYDMIQTQLELISMLKIVYLPFGAREYNNIYGFKKKILYQNSCDIFD